MCKVGDCLHEVILEWLGEDFKPGCSCKAWVDKMNRGGVDWTRKNFGLIVLKLRKEAKSRGWFSVLLRMPKLRMANLAIQHPTILVAPIRCMVEEAIRRSTDGG